MADTTALVHSPGATVQLHQDLAERVTGYLNSSRSDATRRAYRSDWNDFLTWCMGNRHESLPASQAALVGYLDSCVTRGLALSTISRRISAIKNAHRAAEQVLMWTAAVDEVWRGIRRQLGVAPAQKSPATLSVIDRLLDQLDLTTTAGLRDRALLLVGFAGAFRRSELVAIDVDDLEEREGGVVVHVRRSKADQEGKGAELGIPYADDSARCPVHALNAWLKAAGIDEGPVFRGVDRHGKVRAGRLSPQSVALVVKRHAEGAGLDPDRFAGHSLRAGLATAAAEAGVREDIIQGQTRHKSVEMLRTYVRRGSLFRDNAAAAVFATRA